MLLAQHRVARGEQEDRREEVPLDLQIGVGADAERLSHRSVAGADEHRGEHQPGDPAPDEFAQAIDGARKRQEGGHEISRLAGRPAANRADSRQARRARRAVLPLGSSAMPARPTPP